MLGNDGNSSSISNERVGKISFLLTKFAIRQLRPELLAREIGIEPQEFTQYLAVFDAEVDVQKLFHGTPCPVCIVGTIKYVDRDIERALVHLQCSVCQNKFSREEATNNPEQ